MHTTGVLFFCCHKCHTNHINHYTTIIYTNDRRKIQILSHFHTATPHQKLPKTPSSKQLFYLQSKTTRHFPQNNPSLSTKRPVTLHKTTRHFTQNDLSLYTKRPVTLHKTTRHFWGEKDFQTPSTVTLVTAKKTKLQYGSAHTRARKNIFGQHKIIFLKVTLPNPPNSLPHSSNFNPRNIHQQRNINQQRNNLQQTNEFINNEKLHHEVKSNNEGVKGNNKDFSQPKTATRYTPHCRA